MALFVPPPEQIASEVVTPIVLITLVT
ncbi:hypothetical protein ESCNG_20098 [Neisseria gonorrhoeae]|nr:hypothetical protein ESCNG_20098 [Neisseria gonorrhoeae]SCW17498.1 hypothetical protein ESCNG_40047 [Neisseria gonorrhoeae]SCW18558.1 hypothetical protein ESCNG_40081 [Neisseria gonorrhoeae]